MDKITISTFQLFQMFPIRSERLALRAGTENPGFSFETALPVNVNDLAAGLSR